MFLNDPDYANVRHDCATHHMQKYKNDFKFESSNWHRIVMHGNFQTLHHHCILSRHANLVASNLGDKHQCY